jgi:hypothetical protein
MNVVVPIVLVAGLSGLISWLWPTGLPGVKVIKVKFDDENGACVPKSGPDFKKLKQSDQDLLFLRIANDCKAPHDFTVSIGKKLNDANLDFTCLSEQNKAKLGVEFELGGRKKAYLVCTLKYPVSQGTQGIQGDQANQGTQTTSVNGEYELGVAEIRQRTTVRVVAGVEIRGSEIVIDEPPS